MNYAYLKEAQSFKEAQNAVQGMAITKSNRPATCEACITAAAATITKGVS
jgi:hypothetical protein